MISAAPKIIESKRSRVYALSADNLRQLLQHLGCTDSYLESPAYYLFTCRKGLWVYEDAERRIIFGKHPNLANGYLIFPVLDYQDEDCLWALVSWLHRCADVLQIVRLSEPFITHNTQWRVKNGIETILDWTYPVRILSTHRVSQMAGHEFKKLRKASRQLEEKSFHAKPLIPTQDEHVLKQIINSWAVKNFSGRYSVDDLTSPYIFLLKLLQDGSLNLQGLVFYEQEQPIGFKMWEVPFDLQRPANSLASLYDTKYQNIATLMMLEMCRRLSQENIAKVNIGGSETAGLDLFKRHFRPVESLPLITATIEPY